MGFSSGQICQSRGIASVFYTTETIRHSSKTRCLALINPIERKSTTKQHCHVKNRSKI